MKSGNLSEASVLGWMLISYILVVAIIAVFAPYDDTDDVQNEDRSGLHLYKDFGTGCEYVTVPTWLGLSQTDLVLRPGTCNVEDE